MARLVKVWGPSSAKRHADRIVWMFSALREDNTTALYQLTFYFDTRRFKTNHRGESKQVKAYSQAMLTLLEPADAVYDGKVTDLLRSRLSPEQLAEAMAAAITYGRK